MKPQLTIEQSGNVYTAHINGSELGQQYTGSLSGTIKEPLIDALLWYALRCMVEAYVTTATVREPLAKASQTAEAMVGYLSADPYVKNGRDNHAQACRKVQNHLPALTELLCAGPEPLERSRTLKNIQDLAATLERISIRTAKYQEHIQQYIQPAAHAA